RSSQGYTATVRAPNSYAARNARIALSPRLATRIFENMRSFLPTMADERGVGFFQASEGRVASRARSERQLPQRGRGKAHGDAGPGIRRLRSWRLDARGRPRPAIGCLDRHGHQ